MVTIEEIAILANVSRSTVSRVINNDPNVKAVTRTRVEKVIEQINYHPNVAARSLAGGHTGVLGLVVPMGVTTLFRDPYFAMIVQGVSAACNASDHSAMLWLAEPDYERRMVRQLLNKHVIDGMIIASTLIDDPLLKSLLESDLPFFLIGRYPGSEEVSYVDVDNEKGAFEIVQYLVEIGYQKIATITGPLNMVAGFDRLSGYKLALQQAGLAVDEDLIVEADFSKNGGYLAMQKLLPARPDAVFVASDTMAIGAMKAVKDAGLLIPEEIGIAGFDDMPFAEEMVPSLTTVRQPINRCGVMAVQTLIDMIDHPSATHHHVILPTELVVRGSCEPRKKIDAIEKKGEKSLL